MNKFFDKHYKTLKKFHLLFFISLLFYNISYAQDNDLNSLLSDLSDKDLTNLLESSNISDDPLFEQSLKIEENKRKPRNDTGKNRLDLEKLITKIEKFYSNKIGKDIFLKGYDLFNRTLEQSSITTSGGMQSNYILGIGDEIILNLQGGTNKRYRQNINREGTILYDFTYPILAAGKSLADVENEIRKRVKESFFETNVYISLGKLKQSTVIISGEVSFPGKYQISGLSNVLEALIMAGGIKKTGSLRNIQIIQNNKIKSFDLYDLIYPKLKKKNFKEDSLKINNTASGTLIIVPPINKTIAIYGNISGEGIYEISYNKDETFYDILSNTGINLMPGKNKFILQRTQENGNSTVKTIRNLNTPIINGDTIFINSSSQKLIGAVKVSGSYKYKGLYPLDSYSNIQSLFENLENFELDTYKFSFIKKYFDQSTFQSTFQTLDLWSVINKEKNYKLTEGDELILLNRKDLSFFNSNEILYTLKNTFFINKKDCESLNYLSQYILNSKTTGFSRSNDIRKKIELITNFELLQIRDDNSFKEKKFIPNCSKIPEIFKKNPKLLTYIFQNLVFVRGEIENPGIYLVHNNFNVKKFVSFLGDRSKKVIVSPDRNSIDIISDKIKLKGETRFPLEVEFREINKLSNLFKNKNIMTDNTYPFFGLLERQNIDTGIRSYITFNPELILSKRKDLNLQPSDEITLFSNQDIKKLIGILFPEKITNYKKIDNQDFEDDTNRKIIKDNVSSTIKINTENSKLSNIFDNYSIKDEGFKETELSTEAKKNSKEKTTENAPITLNNFDETVLENFLIKYEKPEIFLDIVRPKVIDLKGGIISEGKILAGDEIKLESIIDYLGGYTSDAQKDKIEISNNEKSKLNEDYLLPGSSVFIPTLDKENLSINILGEVTSPRKVGFKKNLSLIDIFNSNYDFTDDAYLLFSYIERQQTKLSAKRYIAFSPYKVIEKSQDIQLMSGDKVIIVSFKDVKSLIEKMLNKNKIFTPEPVTETTRKLIEKGSLESLVQSLVVRVEGASVNPGQYILGSVLTIKDFINMSGGFSNIADLTNINLVYPKYTNQNNLLLSEKIINFNNDKEKNTILPWGSLLRINKIENSLAMGQVELDGAVNQSGTFQLLKGDTIFTLLKKSGGLTNDAYLEGLVLMREEEKNREKRSIKRLTRELNKSIAQAMETQAGTGSIDSNTILALKSLAEDASNFDPLGRIVGNFNNIKTLKNTKLVSGDRIFIPSKPTSITIVGEIMTPGSILWSNRMNLQDYIESAAGFTELADKKKIFVISPNGKAQRSNVFWSSVTNKILPGSTVVVPRRIKLATTLETISAVTSIVYQLTLSLAGIESVLND